MDLERMLHKCHRGQWSLNDIDWTLPPRQLTRDQETAIVQYFVNMAGIERLAKALFEEQRRRARDPILVDIFTTFIGDEERHAQAAERLADYYDVHHYQGYELDPTLIAFRPVFLTAIRAVSAEFANIYITMGELLLDVALLRSLADYVDDTVCSEVMKRINRDESRHIAIDYYMVGHYASAEYQAQLRARPRRPMAHYVRAIVSFVQVLYYAAPFVREIFIVPISTVDPSHRRMREAFMRMQLLGKKPEVAARPFARFLHALQAIYNTPVVGTALSGIVTRMAGVPGEALTELYTEAEARRAVHMGYDEMASEAMQSAHRA